jgi:hypothetical protein
MWDPNMWTKGPSFKKMSLNKLQDAGVLTDLYTWNKIIVVIDDEGSTILLELEKK